MKSKRLDAQLFSVKQLPEEDEFIIDSSKTSYGVVIKNYYDNLKLFISFLKAIFNNSKRVRFIFFIFDGVKYLDNKEVLSLLSKYSKLFTFYISLESLDSEILSKLDFGSIVDFKFFLDLVDKEKVIIL